jgi:A/G-specific adenine glycosylase
MSEKKITLTSYNNTSHKRQFQRRLQQWYYRYGRDLPWRRTTDAYAILVSEVMLQQTQVERVIDYYQRFLQHFPTIAALAAAPLEEVLAVWQGLGYYRRARHLHQTAQYVMEHHQGVFPNTFEEVAALPGVGRYTAGAVLCFAFGQRTPILDTNVQRVLERVFVRRRTKRASAMQKRLWRLAADVLPEGKDAWVINQAMMDLGATVCTARSPQCTQCCLQTVCHSAHSFTRQLGLFVYANADTTDLPRVAEAETPYGGGGTPPPDFGPPSPPRKQRATNTRRT